jgi:hypothetical protein
LWRGEFSADDLAVFLQDVDGHETCDFLEQESRRRRARLRRQHKGSTDIRMARERNLVVHGKNANLCVMRPNARRQHEGSFGIIELGGDGLHLRGREPAGVQHHRERIAAEGAVGKNVHGDVAPLHLISPISIPTAIRASAGHIP